MINTDFALAETGVFRMAERSQESKVELLKKKDLSAFEDLIDASKNRVFRVCYRMLGNYEDALDASQETFLKAYEAADKLRPDSNVEAWVLQIAINICKNRLKSKRRQFESGFLSLDERIGTQKCYSQPTSPAETAEREEVLKDIQSAFFSLNEDQRCALSLRTFESLSYEEIARILKCSVGTVKSRISRAREILKEKLKEYL
jgi:RNA polymerase sigma-70 factor (ECF subfamily)